MPEREHSTRYHKRLTIRLCQVVQVLGVGKCLSTYLSWNVSANLIYYTLWILLSHPLISSTYQHTTHYTPHLRPTLCIYLAAGPKSGLAPCSTKTRCLATPSMARAAVPKRTSLACTSCGTTTVSIYTDGR